MATTELLLKEIETLPEESVAEALNYIIFLKSKPYETPRRKRMSIEDAHGIFNDLKGMDTTIEREEGEGKTKISIEDAYGIFKGIDTHFEREDEDRV